MRKRIPQELDELMWLVADCGEPKAVESFIHNYPECRLELLRRMNASKKLKEAKPELNSAFSIPAFQVVKGVREDRSQIGYGFLVAACIIGVTIGTYFLTRSLQLAPLASNHPTLKLASGPRVASHDPNFSVRVQPNVILPSAPPVVRTASLQPKPSSAASHKISITLEKVNLEEAIQAVVASSGLEAHVAPGIEDFEVVLSYSEMNVMEILEDMGVNFGFTAFDQGDGTLLIVPAVDPKALLAYQKNAAEKKEGFSGEVAAQEDASQ